MNGPQHYMEAGYRIQMAKDDLAEAPEWAAQCLALAQVHATLALAAATAMSGLDRMSDADFREWDKVAGVQLDGDE